MHILIMMPIKSKHMIMLVNYIKGGVSLAIQKLLDITHQKMWTVARKSNWQFDTITTKFI